MTTPTTSMAEIIGSGKTVRYSLSPDPMRMLADINTRLDGFFILLEQQGARMQRMEEMLKILLTCRLPPTHGVPAPTEAQWQGEMLARAIREVSR